METTKHGHVFYAVQQYEEGLKKWLTCQPFHVIRDVAVFQLRDYRIRYERQKFRLCAYKPFPVKNH